MQDKPNPLDRKIHYAIILGKVYRKRLKLNGNKPSNFKPEYEYVELKKGQY